MRRTKQVKKEAIRAPVQRFVGRPLERDTHSVIWFSHSFRLQPFDFSVTTFLAIEYFFVFWSVASRTTSIVAIVFASFATAG
jgi:hypothetical protein